MIAASERKKDLLSGQTLAVALVSIALLALVVPPGLALWLQQSRLARAAEAVRVTAAAFDSACIDAGRRGDLSLVDVLVGPGDPIEQAHDARWLSPRTTPLGRCLLPGAPSPAPDPWVKAIVVNLAAAREGNGVWVLSAGPNGILETPFAVADGPLGDDLGTAVVVPAR